jgi:AcrR family transcriptional regulator
MLDQNNTRDRIIIASLQLAETQGWRDLSLGAIAQQANVPLAELAPHFKSKAEILAAFSEAVDRAVIERFAHPGGDVPRDRVFDVILTRFELLAPYKAALRRIRADLRRDSGAALAQLGPALRSQYWMLAAAGISGEGGAGMMRVNGMLRMYNAVFEEWLNDEDPGMARTMAMLDRRLRRAEAAVKRVEDLRDAVQNLFRRNRRENATVTPNEASQTQS